VLSAALRRTARMSIWLVLSAGPSAAADRVTEWALLADSLGHGSANWHSLAIMHQAMHDAWNAAQPSYARWVPAAVDEPAANGAATGAAPEAALAAAARRVLAAEHPDDQATIEQTYRTALGRLPSSPARDAGTALGDAIGAAALARRADDGFRSVRPFPVEKAPGRWRTTPPEFRNSNTTDTRPFLFTSDADLTPQPPPVPGTTRFQDVVAEVQRMGSVDATARSQQQSEAALYWAYQSSQRGYLHLAVRLLDTYPRPGGLATHTRIMSQLATALADSAVLIWDEKEQFGYWRPITVIREGAPGVVQDPDWTPMIETPPHPEHPSGHASDCFTGANVLQGAFPGLPGPVAYVAQVGRPPEGQESPGMGQHMQQADSGLPAWREFPDLASMAQNCSDSRIWAGAHFRTANEESARVARLIADRALAAVPPR